MTDDFPEPKLFRVLTLDGGGAKGFYTLGALKEVEALCSCPLHEKFDLIYGTSTGAIIAALLGLCRSADEIEGPLPPPRRLRHGRNAALQEDRRPRTAREGRVRRPALRRVQD